MTHLLDLVPGGEEVRCTGVLAVLLELDQSRELLRSILRRAHETWPERRKAAGLSGTSSRLEACTFGSAIEGLQLTTEEAFVLGKDEGRFDLVARFDLEGHPHVVVIEVKVQAAGEHGHQLSLYERQIQEWEAQDRKAGRTCEYSLVLLTLRGLEESTWNSDLNALDHLAGSVTWREVLDDIENTERDQNVSGGGAFSVFASALRDRIEELTMTAKDYQELLRVNHSHFPYPLLVDALEAVAREAAGGERVHKEPRGTEGAPWDESEKSYWCGYWWRIEGPDNRWASLRMEWRWSEQADRAEEGVILDGPRSGYRFEIGLREGDNEEPKPRWSEAEFVSKLGTIVADIRKQLGVETEPA